jgi:hypothetical protein
VQRYTLLAMLVTLAGHANAGLIAGGTDDLSVVQTITSLGGGQWQYAFDVATSDPSPVWEFSVYTSFATTNGTAVTFPHVAANGIGVGTTVYDPSAINPSLTTITDMWYTPFGGPNGLPNGGTAKLTFDASVYDPSAKLFAYETVASGYALSGTGPLGSLGEVEGIGFTNSAVPEPTTLSLLGIGLSSLALFRKRVG